MDLSAVPLREVRMMASNDRPEPAIGHDGLLNVELVLGAGEDRPVRLNVTSARVVDREDGTMEISMSQEDMEEYHAELRLDEVQ